MQIHLEVLHGIFLKRSPRVSNLFRAYFASCFRQQKSRNPSERLICEAEKSLFETQLQLCSDMALQNLCNSFYEHNMGLTMHPILQCHHKAELLWVQCFPEPL